METPSYLDGAKVIQWAWSGEKLFGVITNTENESYFEIFGLAICRYDKADGCYRFSCNKNWEVEQDSPYGSIQDAIYFLPEQYKNVERVWHVK